MRKIIQHATSGEEYVAELDAEGQIVAIEGPYHYADLDGATPGELEYFDLDDLDVAWAREQEWRFRPVA